MNYIGYLSAKV